MNEIILNIHPVIVAIFGVLCVALFAVIVLAIIVDNGEVSSGYDEHARESNWGKP